MIKLYLAREGVIIEWPLNGLFHDCRNAIITSQMVVIRFPSDDGHFFKCRNFVFYKRAEHRAIDGT